MRSLHLPGKAVPRLLAMCPKSGQLSVHSWADLALHLYTLNGRHLATAEGTEKLHALAVSPDGRFAAVWGGQGGAHASPGTLPAGEQAWHMHLGVGVCLKVQKLIVTGH